MKAFLLNLLMGHGFLLAECFHIFSGKKPGALHKISVSGGSPRRKIVWRSFCFALCFFICFFIYCLFLCLLFVYFKGAVCWVMHQLCGLEPLEGVGVAISVEFCGGFGGFTVTYCVLMWV